MSRRTRVCARELAHTGRRAQAEGRGTRTAAVKADMLAIIQWRGTLTAIVRAAKHDATCSQQPRTRIPHRSRCQKTESKKCPIFVEKSRSPHPTSFLAGRAQERHKDPELRKHNQDARDILQAVNESGWRHNSGTNNPIPASHSRNLRFPTLFRNGFPAAASPPPRLLPLLVAAY